MRCGGGANHRMGLSDAALVKDNHVLAAGGVAAAVDAVRGPRPGSRSRSRSTPSTRSREALDAGADLVLLDNFDGTTRPRPSQLARGPLRLEASGGLTLERAAQVAETGVDFLAVGALTHSAPGARPGLDLR